MTDPTYDRDMVGYGARPVDSRWPGGARLALQFALNYEAGGELNVLHGDDRSEDFMTDIGEPTVIGGRSQLSESAFEYGSRCGVWRLLRLFGERDIPISVFGVVMALQRNPAVAEAMVEAGHEIVSHGWRWIDYADVREDVERDHIHRAVEGLIRLTGEHPAGWMTGRPGPNTRRLVVEEGGFLYDRDSISDELPYWVEVAGRPHLVIPTSFETNDTGFNEARGFTTGDQFFAYMKDAFDMLYAEGETAPKMMTVALHDRLIGRPARAAGLVRFLDYVLSRDKVWLCRGVDIARHWIAHHPCSSEGGAAS